MAGTLFCTTATSSFAEDIGGKDFEDLLGKPDKDTTIETIADNYKDDIKNKTIIISTNDNHGAIVQYAYIAAIKNYFQKKEANVLLVDSGDFSSDKETKDGLKIANYKQYGNLDKAEHPERSIELMNAAGYDYACLGNHEFDHGYNTFKSMLSSAKFKILDANITNKANLNYSENDVATFTNTSLKIGLFGLDTAEINGKINDWNAKDKNLGMGVKTGSELYTCAQEQIDTLKNEKNANFIICLSHLGLEMKYAPNKKPLKFGDKGTRSVDVWTNVNGIDLMLDAHSHSTLNGINIGDGKIAPIMSTGIWNNNISIIVIDNNNYSKEVDRYLLTDEDYERFFGTTATERITKLNEYGAGPVIELLKKYTGKSETELFDYDYKDDESSKSENPGKSGRGNDGKHTGRNSGKNNGKYNGKNNNSRFGKRGFEYDEEDTEYEETAEPVEDASVVASTSDESTEFTSEASSDNSSELNEQSTEAASTEETAETSEQDNAEQSEDTEVEPAA